MVSVALFAADEDGVLVRLGLREAGVAATGAYVMEVQSGAFDLREFLRSSRPDVVIYDFVQPAAPSTRWLDELKRVCEKLGIPCVLTVRDVRDLQHIVVSWAACILIRPYDTDMARLAIREALQAGAGEEQADLDDEDGGETAA
jgi:DNA-binding NarL/FixJ family response regulator